MDNRIDLSEISSRLKQIRTQLGFTPKQIFEKTGISTGNLSELENGKYPPSAKTLVLLSELYGVSIDWILQGTRCHNTATPSPDMAAITMPNAEIMGFFQKIATEWLQGDRDLQGWILVQLRLAFPQIAAELHQERPKEPAGEIAPVKF